MSLNLPITHCSQHVQSHVTKRVELALKEVLGTVLFAYSDTPKDALKRAVADAALRLGLAWKDELQGVAEPEPDEFEQSFARGTEETKCVGEET